MHGYKSGGVKDFAGIASYLIQNGFTVVMPDQRGHGKSKGYHLSFGIKESFDVKKWVDYIISRFGADTKIILYGVSMGAATVLTSAGLSLCDNVVGIISDCSYSSPVEIISKASAEKGFNPSAFLPVINLSAKIFGGFSLGDASPKNALTKCNLPILFIHGKKDDFVPFQMGEFLFNSYSGPKYFFTVDEATHATSFFYDTDGYKKALDDFFSKTL